jgi:hypothetical protein
MSYVSVCALIYASPDRLTNVRVYWRRLTGGRILALSLPILILAITLTREAVGSTVTPKDGANL